MKIISHRGNLSGPNPATENTVSAIEKCFEKKFEVEIDVWFYEGCFWLGHDTNRAPLPNTFLTTYRDKLWIHAKNIAAAVSLMPLEVNWFWHERDTLTLTSKGIIWCHHAFIDGGITMLHTADEVYNLKPNIGGICTDYPELALKNAYLRLDHHPQRNL